LSSAAEADEMIQQSNSKIRAILFDLDGTLVQVEMQEFIPRYLQKLSAWFAPEIEPVRFQSLVRAAITGLLQPRTADVTNEELLLQGLEQQLQLKPDRFRQTYRQWIAEEVEMLQPLVAPHPLTRTLVEMAFERECRVVIATNPVFPRALIEARLRWAGLADCPFELVTCYENSCHCKPNPEYFQEILDKLQLPPAACLMVGNDNYHDVAARMAGIPTFLVETWLIDRGPAGLRPDYRGDHQELLAFLTTRC
jgi:HAD superfamily hydrolase (TIGR01549 family)